MLSHSLNWKLIGDQLISILKVNLALRNLKCYSTFMMTKKNLTAKKNHGDNYLSWFLQVWTLSIIGSRVEKSSHCSQGKATPLIPSLGGGYWKKTDSEGVELCFSSPVNINMKTWSLVYRYWMVLCFVQGVVKIAAVNADEHQSLGGQYQIQGFPTIKVFGANKNSPSDYQGNFYTTLKCLYQYQIICITF